MIPAVRAATANFHNAAYGKSLISVLKMWDYIRGASGFRMTPYSQRERLSFRMLPPCVRKILLNLRNTKNILEIGRVLRMVIEAAIVKIDGTQDGLDIDGTVSMRDNKAFCLLCPDAAAFPQTSFLTGESKLQMCFHRRERNHTGQDSV